MTLYEQQQAAILEESQDSVVRLAGRRVLRIPARTMQVVDGSTRQRRMTPLEGVVESLQVERPEMAPTLPPGLTSGRCFVKCGASGIIPVSLTNLSSQDVYLRPRTPLGVLVQAEVCIAGATEDRVDTGVDDVLREMDVSPDLSRNQQDSLRALVGKYLGTFSRDDLDVGCCDQVQQRIPLEDDSPVRLPHRRIPPSYWKEVQDHIGRLRAQGIIQPSMSPYASAIVVARKKDGKLRMCIDYRQLNEKTRKDAYPLPRIEEALEALGGAKYFVSLDLAHGYHQLPIAKEDVPKTDRGWEPGVCTSSDACLSVSAMPQQHSCGSWMGSSATRISGRFWCTWMTSSCLEQRSRRPWNASNWS